MSTKEVLCHILQLFYFVIKFDIELKEVFYMGIMEYFLIIFILIVLIRIINEKFIHMQSDIALVLFSSLISLIALGVSLIIKNDSFSSFINSIGNFKFSEYLIDGVLCFMLFAGASKVSSHKFKANIKSISILAVVSTIISSVVYGLLIFSVFLIFKVKIDIWICILLGCIVSPTDPIAATGILNKLGLSKNVTSVIESESLFNDGTGVALFLFVKSIVIHSGEANFFVVMLREVLGALVVAFVVSLILFKLFKITKSPIMRIIISLLDVSLCYAICEKLGFSGIISSVLCGMYFSYMINKYKDLLCVNDQNDIYGIFWNAVEEILNCVLFVMIGLSLLSVEISQYVLLIIPCGIVIGLIARFIGVLISTVLSGKRNIPGNYSLMEYTNLMTWSALKGGLSLALALSTVSFLGNTEYLIALNLAYVTILFTTIVQGLTVKNVYLKIESCKLKRLKKVSVNRYENNNSWNE